MKICLVQKGAQKLSFAGSIVLEIVQEEIELLMDLSLMKNDGMNALKTKDKKI